MALLGSGCAAAYTSITPIEDGYYITRVKNQGGASEVYFCQVQGNTNTIVCHEIDSF